MTMISDHRSASDDVEGAATDLPSRESGSLSFAATIAVIVLVAINLRPEIVSIGPLSPYIRAEFGLGNATTSLLTAIPALLMGLLAFPTPWLAHRFGRDRVILVALAILMVAGIGRAFAGSLGVLLISTVGVGAGIAVTGALIPGFAKNSFPKQAAILVGIYAMSLGLGSTLAAGLAEPLADIGGGWRLGSAIFALPCLSAIAAWLVVARVGNKCGNAPVTGIRPRQGLPFRHPKAWLIAAYCSANNILFFGFVSWTAPMFLESGLSANRAGLLLASFTAAFMLSNPLSSWISRNQDRRIVISIFAGLAVIGSAFIAMAPTLMPFFFITMIAAGVGGSFTLGMILPLDNSSGSNEANAWSAFTMDIGYFVGALGPLVVGVLRDSTGGFGVPLWLLAAVALLMLMLSPFLQPTLRH